MANAILQDFPQTEIPLNAPIDTTPLVVYHSVMSQTNQFLAKENVTRKT